MGIVTFAAARARFPGVYIVGGDLIAPTDAGLVELGRETTGGFDLTGPGQIAFDAAAPVAPARGAAAKAAAKVAAKAATEIPASGPEPEPELAAAEPAASA